MAAGEGRATDGATAKPFGRHGFCTEDYSGQPGEVCVGLCGWETAACQKKG